MCLSFLGVCGLLICGLAVSPAAERLWISGPDAFFGQVRLTQDSGALSVKDYASNELLKGQIADSEIAGGTLFLLPQDVYFWDPYFPGFPRAELSEQEATTLAARLVSGRRFEAAYGKPAVCWHDAEDGSQTSSTCGEGAALQRLHQQTRLQAGLDPGPRVLQIRLKDGRMAQVKLYQTEGGLAFTAEQPNLVPIEGFVDGSVVELSAMVARAQVEPVNVIWPEVTADRANARAARRLGSRYRQALEHVQSRDDIRQVVGAMREVRPAQGANYSSDWMDSHSLHLTLRAKGEWGEAVVMVRGDQCWQVEMMAGGLLYDGMPGGACSEAR
jgi:hypothetical protein